eukprot:CAMPEP_0185034600 /NCGR_PEP_ID=MMETSP1103-20130426/24638_1 /TAXON_ID=36769 /ORGANISM="Paraphysomonas bandaiensis, Strain Caron Lab Isolate" /LENGTH=241 /DNA_ID=CAMNT_0027571323 /DNA_START=221 /DNA_END=943 /DNA_ORIENTATION=+
MKLFCCAKTLCRECLRSIVDTSVTCPWDKKRWIARSVMKRCEDATPADYLSQLRDQVIQREDDGIVPVPLGTGVLAGEYKKMLEERIAEDSEQIEYDTELARRLVESEAERLRGEQEEVAARVEEDARIARELAEKLNNRSSHVSGNTSNRIEDTAPSTRKKKRGSILAYYDRPGDLKLRRQRKKLNPDSGESGKQLGEINHVMKWKDKTVSIPQDKCTPEDLEATPSPGSKDSDLSGASW